MKKILTILSILLFVSSIAFAQRQIISHDHAVQLKVQIPDGGSSIYISWWENDTHTGAIQIKRKQAEDANFPSTALATLEPGKKIWQDKSIVPGQRYTYEVLIIGEGTYSGGVHEYYSYGYIEAGIDCEEVYDYGKVLVIVDETMAEPLQMEIDRLVADMEKEGWAVVLRTGPRAEEYDRAKVDEVKEIITTEYNKDHNLNTVFLFGRLPVAYSGISNIDGHGDHIGAWASDMYYSDIDNNKWTDNTVNNSSAKREVNHNIPGDGKFDNDGLRLSSGPLDAEIAVGRVDLFNMPLFHKEEWGNPELELLRQYLNKDHAWRSGEWANIPKTGIVRDGFSTMLEGFASSGWRNISSIVGYDNIKAVASNAYISTLNEEEHLFAYGCGGGSYTSCSTVGNTQGFVDNQVKAPFQFLFGSYFGDWDIANNILRAPLASMPYGLTCCWDGRPHWFFHELAMGKSFAHSIRTNYNNTQIVQNSYFPIYFPNVVEVESPQGSGTFVKTVYESGGAGKQMNFLGDPTLRLDSYQTQSVTELAAAQVINTVELTWIGPSTNNIYHFNVYRRFDSEDSWIKLNSEPITAESFIDDMLTEESMPEYQVRVAELASSNTGSYYQVGFAVSMTFEFVPIDDAVDDFELLYSASISPNPASASASTTIHLTTSETTNCEISIYNMNGAVIKSFSKLITSQADITWDLKDHNGNEIAAGSYIIQVKNDRANKTLKFIKK